jgi:hypothetical protein
MSAEEKFIGNGRSAKVYLSQRESGQVATKIFTGETTSKIILYILKGSANPYTWCEDAIKTAMIRRRLLLVLSGYWFGGRLRLPKTFDYSWNDREKAWQIEAEFIEGCHAPMLNPLEDETPDYLNELQTEIMKPLQKHLISSGFDGLVWQAGKGNPVAASNYMAEFDEAGNHKWVWIDLESGVPALFAMNPFSTLTYYLPKCLKHKEWLFDTVDTAKLFKYLSANRECLVEKLGNEAFDGLVNDWKELQESQNAWKSIKRFRKSLNYAASQKKVTEEQKTYFNTRPLKWYCFSLLMLIKTVCSRAVGKISELFTKIKDFNYGKIFKRFFLYLGSGRYRWGFARWYINRQINKWHKRKSISDIGRDYLKLELHNDDISAYLTDFSMHIAIKPFVKVFTWIAVPIMAASHVITFETMSWLILCTGPAARTLYTLWRMTHSLVKSRAHFPVIALLVGILPVAGNLAYPLELVYRSSKKRDALAKFIVFSLSAKIGRKLPIWGGQDSGTEHFMVKLASRITG